MSRGVPDWREVERATTAVFEQLDWQALGDIYFHEDGESEWRERVPQVVACGIEIARALAPRLERSGTSLWVGAGVAEVPLLLAETMRLDREVVACNLIEGECRLLQSGVERALPQSTLRFQAVDAKTVAQQRTFDHVGCISVFTDPERWPCLSGVGYGRIPPVQLDLEAFAAERAEARELAAALFASLRLPGCITTTADEVAWFLDQAEQRGVDVDADEDLYETAVVGDPVGFLRVVARG